MITSLIILTYTMASVVGGYGVYKLLNMLSKKRIHYVIFLGGYIIFTIVNGIICLYLYKYIYKSVEQIIQLLQ